MCVLSRIVLNAEVRKIGLYFWSFLFLVSHRYAFACEKVWTLQFSLRSNLSILLELFLELCSCQSIFEFVWNFSRASTWLLLKVVSLPNRSEQQRFVSFYSCKLSTLHSFTLFPDGQLEDRVCFKLYHARGRAAYLGQIFFVPIWRANFKWNLLLGIYFCCGWLLSDSNEWGESKLICNLYRNHFLFFFRYWNR